MMRLISKEQGLHLEMATAWFVTVYASQVPTCCREGSCEPGRVIG